MFNKGGKEKEIILSSKRVPNQSNHVRVAVTTKAQEIVPS